MRQESHFAGHAGGHFVFDVFLVIVDVSGLVEVAADGVDDKEEEAQDQDGQHDIDCSIT